MKSTMILILGICSVMSIHSVAQEGPSKKEPNMNSLRQFMMSEEVKAAREDMQKSDKALKDAVAEEASIKSLDEQITAARKLLMSLQRQRMELAREAEKNKPVLKENRDKAREKYLKLIQQARKKAAQAAGSDN